MLWRMLTAEAPSVRRNFGLIIAMMVGYNLSGTLVISNYASELRDTTWPCADDAYPWESCHPLRAVLAEAHTTPTDGCLLRCRH